MAVHGLHNTTIRHPIPPFHQSHVVRVGSFYDAEVLSEDGHSWVGIDISPSMLEIAVEREVEGDVLLGDMGQGFGFRAGMFDGAIR